MIIDGDGLRLLDEDECRARLAGGPPSIGRVAFLSGGFPVVLPVNYRLLDGEVVFRTGLGSKLDAALRGAPISFQVDSVDATWEEGWSVLLKGRAVELAGEELARAEALPLRPWGPGSKPRYLKVVAEEVTGRQIA